MNRSRLLGAGLVAMIVLPAVVLAVLGYGSLETEARTESFERRMRVRLAFNRAHWAASQFLGQVNQTESRRPWRDYGFYVVVEDILRPSKPVVRRSPLVDDPPWKFVRGYFQYDPTGSGLTSPSVPPQTAQSIDDTTPTPVDRFLAEVVEILRLHPLVRESEDTGAAVTSRSTAELEWNEPENRRAILMGVAGDATAPPRGRTPVRYGGFIYQIVGPSVCALRRVSWQRADGRSRVVYQGFVIDLEDLTQDVIRGRATITAGDPEVNLRVIDTPVTYYSYPPNAPLGSVLPGLSLAVEEANPDRGAASVAAARERFVLLVGALFVVIGVGLFLLRRTVTAELSLARRRADFVSAVSHELRTPLTGIRMYADMLRDGWVKDEETIRHYHESMARESERLSRLVQNVLDFSALEKGRKDYDFQRGGLAEPVRAAVDLLAPYLDEKGFTVTLEVDPDLPEVMRDADAVQQCVVNLIDNAVKYARDHEPKQIVVAISAVENTVELSVRDHGPGLSLPEREHVFEAFYRGRSKTSKEVGGAGLGLALVARFARAHRGEARVDEAAGGGARFCVGFPAS